jgi:hypothetical protein
MQAGSIVTTRIIMILATVIISKSGGYYTVWSCAKIEATLPNASMLLSKYPACGAYANGSNPNEVAIVKADLDGDTGANAGAALGLSFGMAVWLATAVHAIGVEIYVSTLQAPQTRYTAKPYIATSHT